MKFLLVAFTLVLLPGLVLAQGVRLKDLATFEGVRGNDWTCHGLMPLL